MGDVWLEGKELGGVFLARVPVVALVAVMEKSKGHYINGQKFWFYTNIG